MLRRVIGESPFNLYFGVETLIPTEVRVESLRSKAFDENLNDQLMEESLVLLDENRARAAQKNILKTKGLLPNIITQGLSSQKFKET